MKSYRIKAAVLVSPGKLEALEYDMPEVKPSDLLLKVEMAGICGTDVHMIYSREPFPGEGILIPGQEYIYPQILGHETVGTIAEMDSEASKLDATGRPLEVGDRVTLTSKASNVTHPLLYGWGRGWASHRYIHGGVARIYKLPQEFPPEVGVLVEPLSVGVKAVERAFEPSGPEVLRGMGPGKSVVIQGSGPIGLMITILAKLCGAYKIVVVGAPKERISAVRDVFPEGADVVFEAAGVPVAFAEGLEMVRHGGVYVEVGHFTDRGTIPLNPYILCRKDINLYGSWGAGPHGFMMSRRILEANLKSLPFERIVTHKFTLDEAMEAVETVRRGECMKAVFLPSANH